MFKNITNLTIVYHYLRNNLYCRQTVKHRLMHQIAHKESDSSLQRAGLYGSIVQWWPCYLSDLKPA